MNYLLKTFASFLPQRTQQGLKRRYFRRQLKHGTFVTSEPEFSRLPDWIAEGDWAIDVGANVGHYTIRMAQLVGSRGRVLAFEPVHESFELLSSNVALSGMRNVTLFNMAVSDRTACQGMTIPYFRSGLKNYYMARLSAERANFEVLTIPLDQILPHLPIALVKVDVEGHEFQVLRGMEQLIRRDHPRLIVEGTSDDVLAFLKELRYEPHQLPSSPNRIFS